MPLNNTIAGSYASPNPYQQSQQNWIPSTWAPPGTINPYQASEQAQGYGARNAVATAATNGLNNFQPSVNLNAPAVSDPASKSSNATLNFPTQAMNDATTAAFAHAKDQAAQTATSSMNTLEGALAARGLQGGGYEAGQIGGTLATAANQIGAASRAEAQTNSELQQQAAEEQFQGQVTQRGQNIQSGLATNQLQAQEAESGAQVGLANRSQNIQQQNNSVNALRSLY